MDYSDQQLIASLALANGVPQNAPTPDAPVMEGQEQQQADIPANTGEHQTTDTGMVDTGEQQPQEAQTTIPPAQTSEPDYDTYVSTLSGGLFKTAEELKSSLNKFSEYDTLKQERDAFEAKTKVNPFANDIVAKMNDLYAKGATPDQIESFQKINKVGDISALSPMEAKLHKMVLVDGWRENVAKLSLEQEFPLEDYEEGTPERQIMEEKLRLSAEADKKALETFKAESSEVKPNNSLEEQRLQQVAAQQKHNDYVKANVPAIAAQIQGMGELAFKPKEGDPFKMKFDYPQEFKNHINDKLYEYFSDGQTPINEENIQAAVKVINATYLDDNFPSLAQKIFEQGYNLAEERATNKYENRSGLPKGSNVPPPNVNNEQAYGSFLQGLVKSN